MKFYKSTIALQYFPENTDRPNSAVHRLREWILKNKELCLKLNQVGYNPKSKCFNKRQIKLIYYYLGEPDELPYLHFS